MTKFQKYDLEKRTQEFGIGVINCCKTVKYSSITDPIVRQLIRSSTSIGANYQEANGASSRKDFSNKISICKKEAKETHHWLIMLKSADIGVNSTIEILLDECHQLVLIFSKISSSTRKLNNLENKN
jgi:four helix bundle protein